MTSAPDSSPTLPSVVLLPVHNESALNDTLLSSSSMGWLLRECVYLLTSRDHRYRTTALYNEYMSTGDLAKLTLCMLVGMLILLLVIYLCFFRKRRIVYDLVEMRATDQLRDLNEQYLREMGIREALVHLLSLISIMIRSFTPFPIYSNRMQEVYDRRAAEAARTRPSTSGLQQQQPLPPAPKQQPPPPPSSSLATSGKASAGNKSSSAPSPATAANSVIRGGGDKRRSMTLAARLGLARKRASAAL